jgi:nanoRNase/pAp phosphatase (c-di-AMP/oligoRNAs hydrolase)
VIAERLKSLLEALRETKAVLILPHNNPDPDALASAVALRYLLEQKAGIEGQIRYQGIIGRAENKALVRYLGYPLSRLRRSDLVSGWAVALVDTQPGAGNHALPAGYSAAIVLDHHLAYEPVAAGSLYDIRSDVGATSTMLTEYLQAAAIEPPPSLATALFYGIKTDTMGLSRGASQPDIDAYFYLQRRVDLDALARIERAQVPGAYFQGLVTALQATRRYDDVLVSYLGAMDYPDQAAEVADLVLRLQGVRWALCMGTHDGEMILSVRTRRRSGAARLVQAIVDSRGMAGGHGALAGGQVSLKGQEPTLLARDLAELALHNLGVEPAARGEPIVTCQWPESLDTWKQD